MAKLVGVNKLMINKDHQQLPFNSNRFRIGRSLEMDLCLLDLNISRLHCVFAKAETGWSVFCKSSNGIRVNGGRLEKDMQMVLKHGDTVQLAEQQIYYWKFCLDVNEDKNAVKVEAENQESGQKVDVVKNDENGDKKKMVNSDDNGDNIEIMEHDEYSDKMEIVDNGDKIEIGKKANEKREFEEVEAVAEMDIVTGNEKIEFEGIVKDEGREKVSDHKEIIKEKLTGMDDMKIIRPLFKPPNGYVSAKDILRRVQHKMRLKKHDQESINISQDTDVCVHDACINDSILSASTNQSFSSQDSSQSNAPKPQNLFQCSQIKQTVADASLIESSIQDASPLGSQMEASIPYTPSPKIEAPIPDTASPIFRRATKKTRMISKGLLKLKKLL